MVHNIKIWPEQFRAVRDGLKRHEVRNNDRNYQQGDVVVASCWDPQRVSYTGEVYTATVGSVTKEFGLPEDIVCFTLLDVQCKDISPQPEF